MPSSGPARIEYGVRVRGPPVKVLGPERARLVPVCNTVTASTTLQSVEFIVLGTQLCVFVGVLITPWQTKNRLPRRSTETAFYTREAGQLCNMTCIQTHTKYYPAKQ